MLNSPRRVAASAAMLSFLGLLASHDALAYTMRVPSIGLKPSVPPKVGVQDFGAYRAWADGTLATSCNAYLLGDSGHQYSGSIGDGTYQVRIAGAPTAVTCDMSTDGGGWTLVLSVNNIINSNSGTADWLAGTGAVGVVSPSITGYAKLPDASINALVTQAYRLVNMTPDYQATNPKRFVKSSCSYVHNVVSANPDCRTTYSSLAWANPVLGDTSASNLGIGDRNASATIYFATNDENVGQGISATVVGNNIYGQYDFWGGIFMWVR